MPTEFNGITSLTTFVLYAGIYQSILKSLVTRNGDVNLLFVELVPEANAIFGVRRRTARRTAVIVGSSVRAQDQAEISAAQQQAAAAEKEAAAAKQQAAATGKPLPLGTVVSALPQGCVPTPVGGVEYYYCAGNFYRAVFQGNQLVYVTTKPE